LGSIAAAVLAIHDPEVRAVQALSAIR